ncbi:MAG: DNA polymerase I [Deltaproteobacteria bacterium]|nr:MAG: DNA polymerase I [Deltaproteobacteria bacterium]
MSLPDKLPKDDGAIYLVDGYNFLFRAYHALPMLTGPDGTPTNAVRGFVSMVHALRREAAPPYLAVVFDAGKETFRNELYPAYKANRPEPPADLVPQFAVVREALDALSIPHLEQEGIEADDIIASIATRAHAEGHPVVVVSSDKDLMQLVTDGPPPIYLYDTMKRVVYDPAAVEAKMGVPPEKVADFLALTGDTSDNVPGVPGIGPKTAAALLAEYGDLEGVLAAAPSIKQKKRRERLIEHAEDARISRRLVELVRDADVPPFDAMRDPGMDPEKARIFFEKYGFRSMLRDVAAMARQAPGDGRSGTVPADAPIEIGRVEGTFVPRYDDHRVLVEPSPDVLTELAASFEATGRWVVAILPSETDAMRARPLGVGFVAAASDGPAPAFVWLGVTADVAADPCAEVGADVRARMDALRPLLAPRGGGGVLTAEHKAPFECWEENDGALPLPLFDAAICSYTIDPARSDHGIEALARDMFDAALPTEVEARGKGRKAKPWVEVEPAAAARYVLARAEAVAAVQGPLDRWLEASSPAIQRLFREVEMPLAAVLRAMERRGILLDGEALARQGEALAREIDRIRAQVAAEAGHEVNLDSPIQLRKLLFEERGLPPTRKTKTGYSTDARALEELAALDPIVGFILEYRALAKLKSTYLDTLPRLIHPRTGRLHTRYRQTVAQTGRLSSIDPNLQNIPVRTEHGRRIREAFYAPEGYVLLSLDYSQIELRILAHLSGDENLIRAFREGKDVHRRTAAEIFEVPDDQVTEEMRNIAKAVNYGVIYGQTPFGLARQLGIPRGMASLYIRKYFEKIPGVAAYMEDVIARARRLGYAETILGRRRRIPELDRRGAARAHGERIARNTPLQGSAADALKVAMIRVERALAHDERARMLLTIHDELIFECREDAVDDIVAKVRPIMATAIELDVPIEVHVGVGHTWAECKT